MNESETGDSTEKSPISIIKPWLSVVLIVSIIGGVAISASLIIKLSKHQSALDEASALRVKIDKAKKNIEELENSRLALMENLGALAATWKEHEEKKNELDSINSELTWKTNKVKRLEIELEELDSQRAKLDKLKKDIKKNKEEQSELMKKKSDLKYELEDAVEAERRYKAAKKAEVDSEGKFQKTQNEIKDAVADLKTADDLRKNSEALKKSVEDLLKTKTAETAAMTNEIAHLTRVLAMKKPEAADIAAKNKELNNLIDQLRRVGEQKMDLDKQVAGLEVKVGNLKRYF